jgi:hypothetical protein
MTVSVLEKQVVLSEDFVQVVPSEEHVLSEGQQVPPLPQHMVFAVQQLPSEQATGQSSSACGEADWLTNESA